MSAKWPIWNQADLRNKGPDMGALARKIAERVSVLDAAEFPETVICSHHGDFLKHANLRIGITHRGRKLLVTIYDRRVTVRGFVRCRVKEEFDEGSWVGFNKEIHQARADTVAAALKSPIVDQWNGKDGHTGISIVLGRECPAIILAGVANYCAMPSPFDLRDSDRAGFQAYRDAISAAEQSALAA